MTQNEFNKRIIDELQNLAHEVERLYTGDKISYDISAICERLLAIDCELPTNDNE